MNATHREILGGLIVPPSPGECFWCSGEGVWKWRDYSPNDPFQRECQKALTTCAACGGTGKTKR